jgi:UDP-glucose 4-epimerase
LIISIIAGGAGFVGSNLLPYLINEGRKIIILDNLCRGREEFFHDARLQNPKNIHFFRVDLSDKSSTNAAFHEINRLGRVEEVWHLAANSDIPAGVADANIDFRDTYLTTFNLLECMKIYNIKVIHFASSSAVYGDLGDIKISETTGPLLPVSNYGAMKLASEGLISASCESFLERANLFRFPNVVGSPATHGVILDFIKKLKIDSSRLEVLGNGSQKKSYLHVTDLVEAMLYIRNKRNLPKIFPINIGSIDEGVTVRTIANLVTQRISPNAEISFGTSNRGWIGDVPKFQYSVDRLKQIGWSPSFSSVNAIKFAIDQIATQEGFE